MTISRRRCRFLELCFDLTSSWLKSFIESEFTNPVRGGKLKSFSWLYFRWASQQRVIWVSEPIRVCGNPCVHSRATHPSLIHSTQTTSLKKEWKINISEKGNIYFGFGFQSAGFSLIHANIQHIQLYKIFVLILFSIKVIKCICEAAGVVTEVLWCDLQMYLSVGRAAQSLNHKIMAVGIKTKPLKGDFHVPGINTNQINTICCCPFTGNHPLKIQHLDQLIEIKPKQTQAMS